jgi:hypothetical protein
MCKKAYKQMSLNFLGFKTKKTHAYTVSTILGSRITEGKK